MELLGNCPRTAQQSALNPQLRGATSPAFPDGPVAVKRLLYVLGSVAALTVGPIAASTAAGASLVAIEIFLGLCRLSLAVVHTFSL